MSLLAALAASTSLVMAAPSHHTADGFRNAEPTSHGSVGVALPFFARRVWSNVVRRPGGAPSVAVDAAFLRHNAHHSVPTATWIGHSTVLVQMDGVTFLTDPIWSETAGPGAGLGARRLVPPAMSLDDLPPIDFVVVSHSHYDHADLPTLRAETTQVAGPLPAEERGREDHRGRDQQQRADHPPFARPHHRDGG